MASSLLLASFSHALSQRVHRQLANAQEKLDRAQRHAEEKRQASQQTIERLQREYEQMDVERRDNDKLVEELRKEADDTETKVAFPHCLALFMTSFHTPQMAEHLKKSEAEINELLTEYWKLRHETGTPLLSRRTCRLIPPAEVYMETLANKLNMSVTAD